MAAKTKPSQQALINKTNPVDRLSFIIVVVLLSITPLLVHYMEIGHISPHISGNQLDSGIAADFFTFIKFITATAGAALLVGLFTFKLVTGRTIIPASYVNFPAAAMAALISFSALFAQYKTFSLMGQYDTHMGTIAYLAFLAIFFITAHMTLSTEQAKWFIYALYPFVIINTILGLVYFYGYNLFSNDTFRSLIMPIRVSLNSSSYISSTLYNPDFISGIGGMLAVLFLTKGILAKELKQRFVNVALAVLSFCIVLASLATSGFFTVVVMTPIIGIVIWLSRAGKAGVLTALAALIGFVLVFSLLNAHNPEVWHKSMGFFLASSEKTTVTAGSGAKPATANTKPEAQNIDSEFKLPARTWAAGTGRVYIWRKTAELIAKRPILGYGLDTMAYFFPQDDPEKASGLDDPTTIVDKPHDMYLGLAFGAGVLALLSFLFLIGRHIWACLQYFKQSVSGERQSMAIVLFAGWGAFLVQALFNDPTPGTSTIFWILFGLSAAIIQREPQLKINK